jgi:hypothetical protein
MPATHVNDRTPPLGAAFVVLDEQFVEKLFKFSQSWADETWGLLTWQHH